YHVGVLFLRLARGLSDDLHDLVSAILELLEEVRRGLCGRLLEVVHQDNALPVLLELLHDRCDDLFGFAHLEVERIHVGGENANIAFAKIFDQFGRVAQGREAEERPNRLVAQRYANRSNALLNLVLAVLFVELGKVLVRPGMRADRVASGCHLLQNFPMPAGMLADWTENRLGALIGEGLEHGRCVAGPWAIIEGQDDLMIAQKIISLEMLETEAGPTCRIDLDNA